jgi:hypothetical protein
MGVKIQGGGGARGGAPQILEIVEKDFFSVLAGLMHLML